MGLFVDLISAIALVLFALSSATEDEEDLGQEEIPFDPSDISRFLQEINRHNPMMQKEVDLTELYDYTAMSRDDVTADILTPRGRRPIFVPPAMKDPVGFPPGRPSPTNLQAICVHGDHRPLYSDSSPAYRSGWSQRRAAFVNYAESWFSMCCERNDTVLQELLCCVTQAWEHAVNYFCNEEGSVKDRIYDCCKIRGNGRLKCFEKEAPNKNYTPTLEEPRLHPVTLLKYSEAHFNFDKGACSRTSSTPKHSITRKQKKPLPTPSQNVDISFPPGRPTTADMEPLCRYRKQRPHYDLKCLPRKGYGWLARQSKTINRVEKGFKQCCKRKHDIFICADGKWREEMDRFCKQDKGAKMNFPCCETAEGDERYECFQARAPHPSYGTEPSTSTAATAQELSLDRVCATHKIIKKKFPVGFPLQSFVNQCCPLSTEEQNPCIEEKLVKMSGSLCTSRSPAIRRCCRKSSQDLSQCLSKILMDAISKATNVSLKKKKKCPLS
ncbi:extracellular matrix protein 1 isoform X2 [Genypterus blacodes]|uniref:extracellular matrix protein 1 isoform X2 n=1 Tax=Genypterus blacodes TaxID=154954 RepID=UPI003F7643BD